MTCLDWINTRLRDLIKTILKRVVKNVVVVVVFFFFRDFPFNFSRKFCWKLHLGDFHAALTSCRKEVALWLSDEPPAIFT